MIPKGPGSIPNFGDCAHVQAAAGTTTVVPVAGRLADSSTDSRKEPGQHRAQNEAYQTVRMEAR